jgi:hypothetical protein
MSQLVKTKRQANFKDFKRFGAFKKLVEQKNVVFTKCFSYFVKKFIPGEKVNKNLKKQNSPNDKLYFLFSSLLYYFSKLLKMNNSRLV